LPSLLRRTSSAIEHRPVSVTCESLAGRRANEVRHARLVIGINEDVRWLQVAMQDAA
jgi:hypothetical protein